MDFLPSQLLLQLLSLTSFLSLSFSLSHRGTKTSTGTIHFSAFVLCVFISFLLFPFSPPFSFCWAGEKCTHPHKALSPAIPGPPQHRDTRTTSKQLGGNTWGAYCLLQSDPFFLLLPLPVHHTWYGPGIHPSSFHTRGEACLKQLLTSHKQDSL